MIDNNFPFHMIRLSFSKMSYLHFLLKTWDDTIFWRSKTPCVSGGKEPVESRNDRKRSFRQKVVLVLLPSTILIPSNLSPNDKEIYHVTQVHRRPARPHIRKHYLVVKVTDDRGEKHRPSDFRKWTRRRSSEKTRTHQPSSLLPPIKYEINFCLFSRPYKTKQSKREKDKNKQTKNFPQPHLLDKTLKRFV